MSEDGSAARSPAAAAPTDQELWLALQRALDHRHPGGHPSSTLGTVSPSSVSSSSEVRTHLTECLPCLNDFIRLQRIAFPHQSHAVSRPSPAARLVRGILVRRKRLILMASVAALCVLLPLAYIASNEPTRYQAAAKVRLAALPLLAQLMDARSLAETVVDNLTNVSLQELLETSYRAKSEAEMPLSPKRRAADELRGARVTFRSSPSDPRIVTISAVASRPDVAFEIANAYVEALLSHTRPFNLEDLRVSREFLERKRLDVHRTLVASEQALEVFFISRGDVRLPDSHRVIAGQLAATERDLAQAVSSRELAQARLDSFRGTIPSVPGNTPREVEHLRTQLVELESELLALETSGGDTYSKIRDVKSRIDQVELSLGEALRHRVPPTPRSAVPTNERVSFSEQLISLGVALQSLLAREEALKKRAAVLRHDLQSLSDIQAEYARLLREVETQRGLFDRLSDTLTVTRAREQRQREVAAVADAAQPVSIVDAAPPVPLHNEARVIALATAFVAALGVGTLTAGAREARTWATA